MAIAPKIPTKRLLTACALVLLLIAFHHICAQPSTPKPSINDNNAQSSAHDPNLVTTIIPDWNCVSVNGRTILYVRFAPGVTTALRFKLWNSVPGIYCKVPDVIVFTPGQLLGQNTIPGSLVKFLKDGQSAAQSRKPVFIVVDSAQDYGVQYKGPIEQRLRKLVDKLGLHSTRSVVVGAGALGGPCRREFNAYWPMQFNMDPFVSEKPPGPDTLPDRFLCLGGYPRSHKVFMMSLLHSRGALARFAWSAGTPEADKIPALLDQAAKANANANDVRAYLRQLPHVLDIDAGIQKQQGGKFHSSIYSKGAIHIVLETDYRTTRLRYTEKTIKSIYAGKPFVILASPGVLELLKSHGFRTFHPHIKENYDAIESFGARIKAIADEVDRLLAMSEDDFSRTMRTVSRIAEYNRNWLGSDEFRDRVTQQALFAFGLEDKPGFEWEALESTLRRRGGPDTPYNC
jgi:hypothetical protein